MRPATPASYLRIRTAKTIWRGVQQVSTIRFGTIIRNRGLPRSSIDDWIREMATDPWDSPNPAKQWRDNLHQASLELMRMLHKGEVERQNDGTFLHKDGRRIDCNGQLLPADHTS
jgi:hypothetical protein